MKEILYISHLIDNDYYEYFSDRKNDYMEFQDNAALMKLGKAFAIKYAKKRIEFELYNNGHERFDSLEALKEYALDKYGQKHPTWKLVTTYILDPNNLTSND